MGSFSGLISSPSYSSAVRGSPVPSLQGQGLLLGTHEDEFLDQDAVPAACCCCLATDICLTQALLTPNGADVGWGGPAGQQPPLPCQTQPKQVSRWMNGWGPVRASGAAPALERGQLQPPLHAFPSKTKQNKTYFPEQGKGRSICQLVSSAPPQ